MASHDQGFLVGEGHRLACAERRDRRPKPDRSARGDHEHVDVRVTRDLDQAVDAVTGGKVPHARGKLFDLRFEDLRRTGRDERGNLEFLGMPAHHVERLAANRARAAEHGNPLHAANARRYTKATGAHSSRLSMRSSRPPCPGMRTPESLTPVWRFSSDSIRSPTMVAAAIARP